MGLDLTDQGLKEYLDAAAGFVMRFQRLTLSRNVGHSTTEEAAAGLFDAPLPRSGTELNALLARIERDVLPATSLNVSPHFHAYIISSGNPVAAVAGLLESSMNLCASKWNTSASATEMERCVIRWLAEFIGYSTSAGGVLVSGGSLANATALTVARNAKAGLAIRRRGLCGSKPMRVYTSQEGHSSLELALDMLGMGRDNLVRIPTRDDCTIDCGALEERIERDKSDHVPICVVACAGTTNTGAVDPMHAVADVCGRHGLWFHVDGAYGAPAARTRSVGALFTGMERADSVSLDPHKWLFLPIGVGCLLVRDWSQLKQSCQLTPDYLRPCEDDRSAANRHEWIDYTYEMTRSFRALPVWMTLMAYGSERIVTEIENTIEVMQAFGRRIDASDEFERVAPGKLSTVCLRYRSSDRRVWGNAHAVDELTERLLQALERDGRVLVAGTRVMGRKVVRACSVNHRIEMRDADFLFDVLSEVGRRVAADTPGAVSGEHTGPNHSAAACAQDVAAQTFES